jgi:predicted metal-dependent hydrolase
MRLDNLKVFMKKPGKTISSHNLIIPQGEFFYRLRRSSRARKTITITVNEHSDLLVSAPRSTSINTIEDFIQRKAVWILQKMEDHKKRKALIKQKHYIEGTEFLFLGKPYPLHIKYQDVKRPLVHLTAKAWDVWITPSMTQKDIKQELESWYRAQAEHILMQRILSWMEKLEVKDCQVKVRSQKRIWGSCHHKKRKIFLNWHLVMAPMDVMDYVIVHEICHLFVANHSKRFWKKVESIIPHYKESHQWFKEHSAEMVLP